MWTFRGTDASVASTWFGRLRHARLKVVVLEPTVVALGASFFEIWVLRFRNYRKRRPKTEDLENEDPLEITLKLVTTSRHWRSVRNITIFPLPFSQTKVRESSRGKKPAAKRRKDVKAWGKK